MKCFFKDRSKIVIVQIVFVIGNCVLQLNYSDMWVFFKKWNVNFYIYGNKI